MSEPKGIAWQVLYLANDRRNQRYSPGGQGASRLVFPISAR